MNIKTLAVTVLTVVLSVVSADFMTAQNFHYRKGWEFAEIDWERSAFSEWEDGMQAGEMSSTIMVAACYMREYGVGRNVSKGVSIMENLASKNTDVALFAANFWFPILDDKPFFDYYPHAGGQYNMWSMFKWWQEKDLRATNFGLEANYAKVIKFSKMYLAKVSKGYGANLAKGMIGYCYEYGGNGVSKNLYKALEYYPEGDRFYKLATSIMNGVNTKQDAENTISKILPFIKNKYVLSAIENKKTDTLTGIEKEFIETYISKYYIDEYKKLDQWWENNNPLKNPVQFRSEYALAGVLQSQILKKFEEIYQETQKEFAQWNAGAFDNQLELAHKYQNLWIAYPDDENESRKNEIANHWCRIMVYDIENQNLSDEECIDRLSELKQSPIPSSGSKYAVDFIDRYISDHQFNIVESLADVFSKYTKMVGHKFDYGWRTLLNSWEWEGNEVPYECRTYNMTYGSSLRETGRKKLIEVVESKMPDIKKILALGDDFNIYGPRCSNKVFGRISFSLPDLKMGNFSAPAIAKTLLSLYDFANILKKEDNRTIEMDDYTKYLQTYPNTYYTQYCKDAIGMMTADTFTLDTSKDEIKKLLDSGISKGAAKYVKMVTKKSFLKSKSL